MQVDYVETLQATGFTIHNPNAVRSVRLQQVVRHVRRGRGGSGGEVAGRRWLRLRLRRLRLVLTHDKPPVRITLFTVEEANQLLGEIRKPLERLCAMKREFDRLETRISVLLVTTSGADAENPDSLELRRCRGSAAPRQMIGSGIMRLEEQGVVVKDLDKGLCDFYALNGERLIFLCWHLGEATVSHWHGLHDGFAGRQSIKNAEELD